MDGDIDGHYFEDAILYNNQLLYGFLGVNDAEELPGNSLDGNLDWFKRKMQEVV